MKKLFAIIFFLMTGILSCISCSITTPTTSTSGTTAPDTTTFPTATVRDVPAPAPAPWSGVVTYTEQTYQIEAMVGEEFAIGMFANTPIHFMESNDPSFIKMEDDQMVEYWLKGLNKFGTEWFLFKAIKAGKTNILFQYPIEYTKLFIVVIK